MRASRGGPDAENAARRTSRGPSGAETPIQAIDIFAVAIIGISGIFQFLTCESRAPVASEILGRPSGRLALRGRAVHARCATLESTETSILALRQAEARLLALRGCAEQACRATLECAETCLLALRGAEPRLLALRGCTDETHLLALLGRPAGCLALLSRVDEPGVLAFERREARSNALLNCEFRLARLLSRYDDSDLPALRERENPSRLGIACSEARRHERAKVTRRADGPRAALQMMSAGHDDETVRAQRNRCEGDTKDARGHTCKLDRHRAQLRIGQLDDQLRRIEVNHLAHGVASLDVDVRGGARTPVRRSAGANHDGVADRQALLIAE